MYALGFGSCGVSVEAHRVKKDDQMAAGYTGTAYPRKFDRKVLRERTVDAIRAALEAAGVEFTSGDQPGVRMQRRE